MPATTEIYTLSLHDALPICADSLAAYVEHGFVDDPDGTVSLACAPEDEARVFEAPNKPTLDDVAVIATPRSEEHTSELQSRENLVCRLLLEKKKNTN